MADIGTEPPEQPLRENPAYPLELCERETAAIGVRRNLAGGANGNAPPVGVGLSGGGIRSATFSLGVFQAMAKAALIGKVDFLSTVSGGGYFGSFLGRLFTRPTGDLNEALAGETPPANEPHGKLVERILLNSRSAPMAWLRENGRYLSPNGSGDTILGLAVILRNWAAIQVVLIVFVLGIFLATNLVRCGMVQSVYPNLPDLLVNLLPDLPSDSWIWWSPYLLLPATLFVFWAVPLGWSYWLVQGPRSRETWGWVLWAPVVAGTVPLLITIVDRLIPSAMPSWHQGHSGSLAVVSLLTGFCYFLAWLNSRRLVSEAARKAKMGNFLSSSLAGALIVILATLAFGLVDTLGQTLYACITVLDAEQWVAAAGAVLVVLVPIAQRAAVKLGPNTNGQRLKNWQAILTTAVAAIVVVGVLTLVNTAAHAVAWQGERPAGDPGKIIAEWLYTKEHVGVGPSGEVIQGAVAPKLEEAEPIENMSFIHLMMAFLGSVVLSACFGHIWPFVNHSSLQPMYGARLTRAYLGASNRRRWGPDGAGVTQIIDGDDLRFEEYRPDESGGPLHLINVTINETVDGKSQIEQRDRKGLGMAVGPCGVSVGVEHHAIWSDEHHENIRVRHELIVRNSRGQQSRTVQESAAGASPRPASPGTSPSAGGAASRTRNVSAEALNLGRWVSISGAAFSTGLGARTNIGLSLLCGMANLRLGYWWNSGVKRQLLTGRRKSILGWFGAITTGAFSVQMYLLDEFLARFPGTARRHWYLSDGGHFENMGGYELIRRRLPFIIICDGEQDENYTYEGMANFVRKARADFAAEITFLSDEQLDAAVDPSIRRYFGSLDRLRRGHWSEEPVEDPQADQKRRTIEPLDERYSLAHAALARVRYDDNPQAESIILYIKPTLTGDEPTDVKQYHSKHPNFPHESTADQFFDEAQWESYRRLGEHIGSVLFDSRAKQAAKWIPSELSANLPLNA